MKCFFVRVLDFSPLTCFSCLAVLAWNLHSIPSCLYTWLWTTGLLNRSISSISKFRSSLLILCRLEVILNFYSESVKASSNLTIEPLKLTYCCRDHKHCKDKVLSCPCAIVAFWLHHNWRTLDLSLGHCPQVSTVCRSLQWPQLNSFFLFILSNFDILYIIGRDENQNSAPLSGSPWNNRILKRTRRVTEPTVLPLNVPSLRSILIFFLFCVSSRVSGCDCVCMCPYWLKDTAWWYLHPISDEKRATPTCLFVIDYHHVKWKITNLAMNELISQFKQHIVCMNSKLTSISRRI